MKKKVLIGIVFVLTLSLSAPAWDVLGHAFIMEQIKGGPVDKVNANELYGITSPDFVNYMIGTPYASFCYDQTHANFMTVWDLSNDTHKPSGLRSAAMGFVAHNGLWGADYIAHVSALTGDTTKGYVINQAIFLEQVYAGAGVWAAMGIADAPYELKLDLCHNIVEFIIDIQIWMHDPALAGRVMAAAAGRDAGFPGILTQAYSQLLADFSQTTGAPLSLYAAQAWIQGYEAQFQQREVLYASLYASATDLAGAITNLSAYLSVLANTLYGLQTTPAGVAQILWLAFDQLPNAISELDGTAKFVRAELAKHQVFFGPRGYMDSKARTTKGSQSSR